MFFRGEKDEHSRFGESSCDNKLATEVTHGGELRRSHQEQFETLRRKLHVLESETRFSTEAARELREKQKLLIGSKKYAEAFDNLKVRNWRYLLTLIPKKRTFPCSVNFCRGPFVMTILSDDQDSRKRSHSCSPQTREKLQSTKHQTLT